MALERKTIMISARLPKALTDRVDYVTRNLDIGGQNCRSTALRAAVEAWLPIQEERLRDLGVLPKKAR